MKRGIALTRFLFAFLAVACVGLLAYTASSISDIDRPVAAGIIAASAVAAIWNLAALWKSSRSGLQESRLAAAFATVAVAALVGLTAVAYAGVGPFSNDGLAADPGNNTQGHVAEPTLTPSPTASPTPDYLLTRQDRSLRASLDAVCFTPDDSITVEMSIRNVGNSTLAAAGIRYLPRDEAVENPLADPTNPFHAGIPPGQESLFRHSDDTHLELPAYDVDAETYLVLYFEDEAGAEYGLTFPLPPASRVPECG